MKVTLYTLPTCGLCHMIKTKLKVKDIQFEEQPLEEIAEKLNINHAPVMMIGDTCYTSAVEMVNWINAQE